jgi:hypothetical protein
MVVNKQARGDSLEAKQPKKEQDELRLIKFEYEQQNSQLKLK